MKGLQKVLKIYGRMKVGEVMWAWDYAKDKPRIESEMTKEEMALSEKAKWSERENPLINAARGRDGNGVNNDEF